MKQSVDLMNSMTLMKSRHINTKRYLTGTARRASFLSTLLSSALLFGALTFVGTQPAQAQTVSITKDMPDAFETKTPTIGDGQYYYIQFYEEITYAPYLFTPFLAEFGDDGQAINAQDYLPFADNRLWTLEAVSDANKFKLKSKRGNYIYLDGNTFKKTSSQAQATEFELISRNSYRTGYYELRVSNGVNLAREKGNLSNYEWATITSNSNNSVHNFVRFAQLKPNVAHIIYYRQEHSDGYSNSQYRANHTTTRHYLTYSGADNEVTASVIFNGDLNAVMGGGDASCFYIGDPSSTTPRQATITNDIGVDGSKGISITSRRADTNPQDWDTQFFIRSKDVIPAGKTVHVKFDYKASANVNGVATQAQSEPGNFLQHGTFGSLNFTTSWQTYETTVTINDNINNFQTIALNLSLNGTDGVVYYFDNIVFEAPITTEVSSRRSIIPSDKSLWTLPTAAAYHQDGLWELIPDGNNGNFYIKRFGEEQYLTIRQLDSYQYYTVLGNKDDLYGRFELETPIANRYTRIHNTCRLWGLGRYISYNGGDGTPIIQGAYNNNSWWYAAFYPVEVPVPNKDDFFQVRVGINPPNGTAEAKEHILLNVGRQEGVTYKLLPGSTDANMVGATFTPSDNWQNIFQYKAENGNALQTNGHKKIVVRFAEPVQGDWAISGIVNGKLGWEAIPQGSLYYEMDLTGFTTINDFTIFTQAGTHKPISIAEVYFYDGTMLSESGNAINSSEGFPDLWQLEQVDDYRHFRLKNPNNGRYLAGNGQMTQPNDPDGNLATQTQSGDTYITAETDTNEKFWTDFSLTWYYVNPVPKEIPVDYMITHRMSYLKDYTTQYQGLELDRQGLTTDAQSYWWNYDSETQKVNHFEITHYVKQGQTITVPLPTILNASNDHVYYQRWYHYNDTTCNNELYPDGTDIEGLKSHLSIDSRDDGDVQYFLYKNGIVTGQKLDWTGVEQSSYKRNVQRNFYFTNSDGKAFTVAADVSRYSDFTYENESNPLQGDLEEPSLTMRYIYYMRDAKTMAAQLTACAPGTDKWLETKTFHFPARQIFYESQKKAGYRGEFIGLRHLFSDYWVFENSSYADAYNEGIAYNLEHPEDQRDLTYLDEYLRSAVTSKSNGRIEVEIVDDATYPTGIRKGGWNPNIDRYGFNDGNDADYEGFYFYDMMDFQNVTDAKASYGDSRFIVFRYPASRMVNVPTDPNVKQEAKINVYLNYNGTKYQLAQFTIIFDPGTVTLPYKQINGTSPYVLDNDFKDRDPKALVDKAGEPIAKVTFDYPTGDKYHFPAKGSTKQGWWEAPADASIDNSSPIPLIFDKTNYAYMGFECNWGSYSIVTQMTTNYGNHQNAMPANDNTYGYGHADYPALQADPYLQNGFLYIDASEQPGDICSAPFVGDFCAGDKLMFSGWISGSNKAGGGDNRCPGGITLTVKGEHKVNGKMQTETLYRFCPGQIYELDNNTGTPDGSGVDGEQWLKNAQGQYIDNNGNVVDEEHRVPNPNYDNNKYYVVWQQFYFEFLVTDKYDRHWIEVNNNCVSSKGGDFMLDNIEVYAIVPEVEPEINTPLCVSLDKDGNTVTEMRLLKLSVDFNKLKSSSGVNDGATENPQLGFVFLDKYKFLETFRTELAALTDDDLRDLHLSAFIDAENPNHNIFNTITLDELAAAIEDGELESITGDNEAYQHAFDAAILGNKTTWYSNKPEEYEAKKNSSILYFEWDPDFEDMPLYSFSKAVNKTSPVYREVVNGVKRVVMNGNFPQLDWKINTDYYIVDTNVPFTSGSGKQYSTFNICSECSKTSTFRIESPYTVLGLEKSEETSDYIVCEGQIPTIALNLKGYDLKGNEVDMKNLNFDWWLGKKGKEADNTTNPVTPAEPPVLATLEKYHDQKETIDGEEVRLDKALATLRAYYPAATSLDGIIPQTEKNPFLTGPMIKYLKKLVAAGELVLHQTSVSVPAEKVSNDDPYFYIVACPIHDEAFNQALNPAADEYVAYFCDEPQGLRIKVGEKAPTLKTGFVPGEHSFDTYDYAFPAGTNPVLSIRLAKAAQFETVKNTAAEVANVKDKDTGVVTYNHSEAVNYLWLPIRNAMTQTADGVIKKSMDDNIYLASSNDPTWDKKISKEMSKFGSLPVVGRIVQLTAKNTRGQSDEDLKTNTTLQKDNRLCVYFTKDFNVREGYNYTLSLPFQEQGDVNTCDGTILINLKIVPDYEVWTGGAGNTDWNNDENWRRADGNTTISNDYYGDELYRANGAVNDPNSPLHDYTTNKANYYSSSNKENAKPSSDQILRKGFAPLYCTHILMKNDEWGNAPVLYDAIDGNENGLTAKPFPNLRDTSTPILKFDMQARRYDMWEETYGESSDRGESSRPYDLIAEMYQINSCDEIAMQPGTELLNAHLMNYNSAWMEYELDTKRWYLLGSPLQGTISGEWYASTGTAQQKTTYYDNVTFGNGYDRYSPAIYQRSWDKAKAVLYEVGSKYDTTDDSQTANLGSDDEGIWSGEGNASTWTVEGGGSADQYLDRLGYKPMGGKKANVAIKGIWSNTYNDAQVDYATGGFSVMVMNHLKGKTADVQAIVRLPKEDTFYDYYGFDRKGGDNVDQFDDIGTNTQLSDVRSKNRALNRGRLKTDLLLPEIKDAQENLIIQKTEKTASRYGDQRSYTRIPIKEADLNTMNGGTFLFTENVAAGASNLGYYLVENPFPCGLDMNAFFAANPGLEKKYWILTPGGQQLVQWVDATGWVTPTVAVVNDGDPNDETTYEFAAANGVLAPGQGFFVQAKTPATPPAEPVKTVAVNFNSSMQAQTRYGVPSERRTFTVVVGQAQTMEQLVIDGELQFTDVDLNGNGIYGEEGVEIDGETVDEKEPVMVPKYQKDGDEYVLDEEGNKIPDLTDIEEEVTIYNYVQDTTEGKVFPLRARTRSIEALGLGLVITAQRGDMKSSALVMQREGASNDFLPSEDTETFICIDDQKQVPTVYTLCGRLATTINSIHDFRSLAIGVDSNSDAPCTLTFKGVEMLGDSIAFYDALEQKLTPLKSGMTVSVSGQTQNRYYLVRSLIKEEAAAETHLQIFTEGLTAKVIASTGEPITSVRCYDTAGRLIHSASPQTPEYSFSLPIAGIYIISAETENDRKTIKLMAK